MPYKKSIARLFVIVGADESAKDNCIEAIKSLGKLHAETVKKRTTRNEKLGDNDEMVCQNIIDKENSTPETVVYKPNPDYDMEKCDFLYERKGNIYGLVTKEIWDGLKKSMFQVVSITNIKAIKKLKQIFSGFMVLIYIHSANVSCEEEAYNILLNNYLEFKHILIYEDKLESLYDQFFRLFKLYESNRITN